MVSSAGAATCTACSAGTYANRMNNTCVSCPMNTFAKARADSCRPCPAGLYSSAGEGMCLKCPFGSGLKADKTGCELKDFKSRPPTVTQNFVPVNSPTPLPISLLFSGPTSAPTFPPPRSKICDPGSEFSETLKECSFCKPGFAKYKLEVRCKPCIRYESYYAAGYGNPYCVLCTGEKVVTANGTACVGCDASYYLETESRYAETIECSKCPPGMWSRAADKCHSCPEGSVINPSQTGCLYSTPTPAPTPPITPNKCAPGYGYNSHSNFCYPCLPGYANYNPLSNSSISICTLCHRDEYNPHYGQTSCLKCEGEKVVTAGRTKCAACRSPYFKQYYPAPDDMSDINAKNSKCMRCPRGSWVGPDNLCHACPEGSVLNPSQTGCL